MHLKNCKDCGMIITPEHGRTLRCPECAKARRKKLQKIWVQNNREHIREYNNKWYIAQIHAQKRIGEIRREHLYGVSEIDILKAQNKKLVEMIDKLLNYSHTGQWTINLQKLKEKIEEIKNNPVKSGLGSGARLPRLMVTDSKD